MRWSTQGDWIIQLIVIELIVIGHRIDIVSVDPHLHRLAQPMCSSGQITAVTEYGVRPEFCVSVGVPALRDVERRVRRKAEQLTELDGG